MKDYEEEILNIMYNTKNNIKTQLDKAYKSGYEDAKSNAINLVHGEGDRAYQQGLEDAWKVAKKIAHDDDLPLREIVQIFGTSSFYKIVMENTVFEAIAKIKEHEKKQDTIQVGDEVITEFNQRGIAITNIPISGDISVWFPTCSCVQLYPIKELAKTGRHFDQISEAFAEMKGETENDQVI